MSHGTEAPRPDGLFSASAGRAPDRRVAAAAELLVERPRPDCSATAHASRLRGIAARPARADLRGRPPARDQPEKPLPDVLWPDWHLRVPVPPRPDRRRGSAEATVTR